LSTGSLPKRSAIVSGISTPVTVAPKIIVGSVKNISGGKFDASVENEHDD